MYACMHVHTTLTYVQLSQHALTVAETTGMAVWTDFLYLDVMHAFDAIHLWLMTKPKVQ